jgi:hypothetical protein
MLAGEEWRGHNENVRRARTTERGSDAMEVEQLGVVTALEYQLSSAGHHDVLTIAKLKLRLIGRIGVLESGEPIHVQKLSWRRWFISPQFAYIATQASSPVAFRVLLMENVPEEIGEEPPSWIART